MKTPLLISLSLLLSNTLLPAAVTLTSTGVFVEGIIEGSLGIPGVIGETIDYLTFEVTTTGPVRLIATDITRSIFLAMGVVFGGGEPFDVPGFPYVLYTNHSIVNPPELTFTLNPGLYLVQVAEEEFRGGDLYEFGYLPVNRSGGGFVASPYSFTLEGQFQSLAFMEGNLNGTFTVTQIVPEPSTAALAAFAAMAGEFFRRRR